MSRILGNQGWKVLGSEISFEMLQAAVRLGLPEHSLIFQTDGVSIPLADESVDLIWACTVLKYSLFPAGSRCLHNCPQVVKVAGDVSASVQTNPFTDDAGTAYSHVAREMYRILKPSGRVVQIEIWVNSKPEVFMGPFRQAGFAMVETGVLRRYTGYLERNLERLPRRVLPDKWALTVGKLAAELRYRFDDPNRLGGGFKDYCFIWRK